MSFLLLHQTLVVPRDFHCQVLFCLDQELHPRFTLLQEGLLLQQEGLEFAAGNQKKPVSKRNLCQLKIIGNICGVFDTICACSSLIRSQMKDSAESHFLFSEMDIQHF